MKKEKKEELRRLLKVISRAVEYATACLDSDEDDSDTLFKQLASQTSELPSKVETKSNVIDVKRSSYVKNILTYSNWPEAVPEFLITGPTLQDQINRANAVIDMMVETPLKGMNFLDFGCGDGWISQEAARKGTSDSFGYDIKRSSNWGNLSGTYCTDVFEELADKQFDVIMLYDVLDHCTEPIGIMDQILSIIKPNGKVYVRCHPWTSKHATHIYKQGLNKSHIHLFLEHQEIVEQIGDEPIYTRIEKDPLVAYHWWFSKFDIVKENIIRNDLNEFFKTSSIKQYLFEQQQIPLSEQKKFLTNMEIEFVDFTLTPKK